MTELYFIRHAEPNFENHNDSLRELTPKGMKDRELVTDFLRDKKIDAVLSSPYVRSFDTVKHFADSIGCKVETIDDFRERKVGGEWTEDFIGYSRQQWADFSYKLPDGESLSEVQARNINAINYVLEKYKDKTVAIGSHGTALSTIINYYDRSYGFDDFMKMAYLMPWAVRLRFNGNIIESIEMFDLFS